RNSGVRAGIKLPLLAAKFVKPEPPRTSPFRHVHSSRLEGMNVTDPRLALGKLFMLIGRSMKWWRDGVAAR
ncbi:hypothetical protein WG66_008258, partial [Moniliophthora roreri]